MRRRVNRAWLAAAGLFLLLGLALISPAIMVLSFFFSNSYTVGFDPVARQRLELATAAGTLLIVFGGLALRAAFARRHRSG